MALAKCALTVARVGPKIVYQVLFYPVSRTNAESSIRKTYIDGLYLSTSRSTSPPDVQCLYQDHDTLSLNDPSQSPNRRTNLASVLMSTTEELEKLPPTIISTAGGDPLQAEGEEFGYILQQAGVPVAIFRCDG
jgi:acetyl esterase